MTTITSICVFCGSKVGDDPAYTEAARRLGVLMAGRGVRLVYGGGRIGLMGVLAEAVLQRGGEVIGVIPDFLTQYEVENRDVTELIVVGSMHDRKRRMFEISDGFVVLPGGLGTLDETLEITTWKQLQLHAKPIVMVDVGGYWGPFKALIQGIVAAGFAHPAIAELFTVVDGVDDVFAALEDAPEPREVVLTSHL